MLRIGVTGGIACGKSHVVRRLGERGFPVFDLDRIAHEVIAPGGAAYADVVAAFGPAVLAPDRTVDRKTLGALVFRDAGARARLNAIVHPRVAEEEARRAAAWAGDPEAVVVTEAALLVEAGMHLRFDRLVVVHCAPQMQVERLVSRDGIDEAAARARVESQMPMDDKRWFAHFQIDTSGARTDTDSVADALADQLRRLAKALPTRAPIPLERAVGCILHGPAQGPRGVHPDRLLVAIAQEDGLELERVARLLTPAADGPWYRAACPGQEGPGPEALAGPLVLWAATRGRIDSDFLTGAAASLARLTHLEPRAIGAACFQARLLEEVARGAAPEEMADVAPRWAAEIARWGVAPTARETTPLFSALGRYPNDPAAAREACRQAGGDAGLAGAVVGLAAGSRVEDAPGDLVEAVQSLTR